MSRTKIEKNIAWDDERNVYYVTLNFGKDANGKYNKKCVYTLVFKGTFDADYYTYDDAKKLLNGQQAALKSIYVAASHRITEAKYTYGAKKAKLLGVYPYCFLPKKGRVSSLENPIKLLHRKLDVLGVLS